jgi:AcrR family transcriptional regulator
MSAEEVANNKRNIIRATMEMIREGGIESVSARTLGSRVGMNSALIYRYFKDIDEIILFACVHVLQEYTQEMTAAQRAYESTADEILDSKIYLLSWELFCKHAFSNPNEYSTLFFSKHSDALPDIIREYHELFPRERHIDDDVILEGMYRTSSIRDRNLVLLIPVLEGRKSDQDIILINDLTVSFFFALLSDLTRKVSYITAEGQKDRMLRACRYLADL